MSAHPLTHRYLEKVAAKANLPILSLNPEDTWETLGIADDHTMSRLAGALQNVAADYNPEAHITPGELSGGKDVGGGLIVTWDAAALGTLTRDEATGEIREAQGELEQPVQEVVVTAKRKNVRKKAKKKSPRERKSGTRKGSNKRGAQKRPARAQARKRARARKRSAKRK